MWKLIGALIIEALIIISYILIVVLPTLYYKCNKCTDKSVQSLYMFSTKTRDLDLGVETRHYVDDFIIVSYIVLLAMILVGITRFYYAHKIYHMISVVFLWVMAPVIIYLSNRMSTGHPFPLEVTVGVPPFLIILIGILEAIPFHMNNRWPEIHTPGWGDEKKKS